MNAASKRIVNESERQIWPLVWAGLALIVLGLGIAALVLSSSAQIRNDAEGIKIMVLVNNVTNLEFQEFINLHNVTVLGQNITDIELRITLLQGDLIYAEFHIYTMITQLLLLNQRIYNIYNYNLTAIYQMIQYEHSNITFIYSEINRLQDLIALVAGQIGNITASGITTVNNVSHVDNNIDLLGECGINIVPDGPSHAVDITGQQLQLSVAMLMYRLTVQSMILFQHITMSSTVINTINGRSPIAGNIQLVSTNGLSIFEPGSTTNAVRLRNRVIRSIGHAVPSVPGPQPPNGAGAFATTSPDGKIALVTVSPNNLEFRFQALGLRSLTAIGGMLITSAIPNFPCPGLLIQNELSNPAMPRVCQAMEIITPADFVPSDTFQIFMPTRVTRGWSMITLTPPCLYQFDAYKVAPLEPNALYSMTIYIEITIQAGDVYPTTPSAGVTTAGLQVLWCLGAEDCITNAGPYERGPILGTPVQRTISTTFTRTIQTGGAIPPGQQITVGMMPISPSSAPGTPAVTAVGGASSITFLRIA